MSVFTYPQLVEQLVGMKVPRDKAEQRARELCPDTAPAAPDPATIARDAAALEKDEQREVWKRFTVCGFKGYWLSQARDSKQTPGLADLWFVHRELPIALWWETKRQVGGKHSPAQLEFAEECARCGVRYGTGDRYDAEQFLIAEGLAGYIAGVFEPLNRSS